MPTEILFDDRQSLFTYVAKHCASYLSRGVEKQGRASFIVPGGSTPAPVFEQLSRMSLAWHNILVAPTDERWVDAEHEQSNEGLIRSKLLVDQAADATFIPLKTDAKSAEEGAVLAEANIAEMPQPFDVCLLGMGGDGHFASIFPGCGQINEALDSQLTKKCIAIDATGCPVAGELTERLSLSLAAILNSKRIVLLITGEEKLEVIRKAQADKDPAQAPIAALLTQSETPVDIFWAE